MLGRLAAGSDRGSAKAKTLPFQLDRREPWVVESNQLARLFAAAALCAAASSGIGCAREANMGAAYPTPYPYPYGYAPPYGYPPGYGYAAPYPPPPGAPGLYGGPPSLSGAGNVAPLPGAHAAIAFAKAQLGRPYCWGGNGPGCFDCSGLTHAAWRAGGKAIPRTSSAQSKKLTPVAMEAVRPGDIVWRPGHVGLYVGDGFAIHAPGTGDVVQYQEVARFKKAFRP